MDVNGKPYEFSTSTYVPFCTTNYISLKESMVTCMAELTPYMLDDHEIPTRSKQLAVMKTPSRKRRKPA